MGPRGSGRISRFTTFFKCRLFEKVLNYDIGYLQDCVLVSNQVRVCFLRIAPVGSIIFPSVAVLSNESRHKMSQT